MNLQYDRFDPAPCRFPPSRVPALPPLRRGSSACRKRRRRPVRACTTRRALRAACGLRAGRRRRGRGAAGAGVPRAHDDRPGGLAARGRRAVPGDAGPARRLRRSAPRRRCLPHAACRGAGDALLRAAARDRTRRSLVSRAGHRRRRGLLARAARSRSGRARPLADRPHRRLGDQQPVQVLPLPRRRMAVGQRRRAIAAAAAGIRTSRPKHAVG
ncbi:MAG: hypothetical protein MZW92_21465 [Comamonadaceae bacterium]|nr:hypothetical protein [Comamonadaceae bacterium]